MCGHAQIYPVPTSKEDKKFYDEDQQAENIGYEKNLVKLGKKTKIDTIRRANQISSITRKGGSILEIGSGHGFFLEEMRKRGYKITGIEVSKQRRIYSKNITRVKVLNINLKEETPNIGKFDTMALFQVLEHITEPVNFLKNIRRLLKPRGGKVVIEVPNFDDFQIALNTAYSNWYWQRAHIHYFSPKILKQVLLRSGFVKIKISGVQRYSIENMFSWKITRKPQMNSPTLYLPQEYEWIEKPYKQYLEKTLKCDTLIVIGENKSKDLI
jgi:2-polyprenyl-3-methyl-5-hydroxy-6-metoxy-1,4-benzoquinol methylase